MASSASTPAPTTTTTTTAVAPSWLKQHETIILVFMTLAVVAFVANKVVDWRAEVDKAAANVKVQVDNTQAAEDQTTAAALASLRTELVKSEAALEAKTNAKIASLKTPAQVATVLGGQPTQSGDVQIPITAATSDAKQLTFVPDLSQELADEKALETKDQALIQGLNLQIADDKAACDARVTAQKASDRKHTAFMLKLAAVLGAVAGGFIGHGI